MNRGYLSVCRMAEIEKCNTETLKDITNIKVDMQNSVADKIIQFITKAGNPYVFRVNNTPVKIVFAEDGAPAIEDILVKIASGK